MRIIDLIDKYPLVYQAALSNQFESKGRCDYTKLVRGAFRWIHSKEGLDFWSYIDRQEFEKAATICPHLFESNLVEMNEETIEDYIPFCIIKDYEMEGNPLWTKYVRWLNLNYKVNFNGLSDLSAYGVDKDRIAFCGDITGRVLSLEKWNQLVNNNQNQNNGRNKSKTNKREKTFKLSKENSCAGKAFKIDRPVPTVTRGTRPTGNAIRGRTSTAAIESRCISYTARIVKS